MTVTWPTTTVLTAIVVVSSIVAVSGATLMWDNNPALSQFPPQWVNSQLQQRRPSIPSMSSAASQQQRLQPMSASAQLSQYEQQQLDALLNSYAGGPAPAAASAFSDSNFLVDNANDDDSDSINDLLFNAQNNGNNNDALSPYAMELLREAYGSQNVPVAEFKPIYGDNSQKSATKEQSKPMKVPLPAAAAAVAGANKNSQKFIPTSMNDLEKILAENMFGPLVAKESFKSLNSRSSSDDEPYVETADNVNRNTYSKLTKDDELRLNTEKRLSDASNTLILNGFGGISSADANDNDDGSGSGFGSTAHAMFSGKSRLSVMAVVFACTGAAIFGVIAAATFYRRVRTRRGGHGSANLGGVAGDSNYPAYGVTGPIKPPSSLDLSVGDRKLAKSAETYHYQNQKRAMLATDRAGLAGGKSAVAATDRAAGSAAAAGDESDSDLDEGSECGDYTVYECPGLAPAGCMEVQNPLFIGSDAESISPRSDRAEE